MSKNPYIDLAMPIDADACVNKVLYDCLTEGSYLEGSKENSWEILHYQTGIANSRARVMLHPSRPLNPVVAVARFIWMIAASNRVEDIAYYEPKVRNFSDDGLTVPGSDYGMRIFQPRPGLNQIQGVVDRLKRDPSSRQAASVVWQPEDAVRASGDIPCTFGMFFHIREGQAFGNYGKAKGGSDESVRSMLVTEPVLHMSTVMRSNNAFRILPFNIFEFTMLHELVASELGVALGHYKLWAASMHAYDNERETPAANDIATQRGYQSTVMPKMPSGNPLWSAQALAVLEAHARHASTPSDLQETIDEGKAVLAEYWYGFLAVVLAWKMAKSGWIWDQFAEENVPDWAYVGTVRAIDKMLGN